jgi:hypothetical protein
VTFGVAINLFECINTGIGNGHEFNHPVAGVAGHPGTLVEVVPTQFVGVDVTAMSRKVCASPSVLTIYTTSCAVKNGVAR